MTAAEPPESGPWNDALRAAVLFLVDPFGSGGIIVSALPGPVRDAWLEFVRERLPPPAAIRKLPIGASEDRLFGGLDLAATLQAGRPVTDRGLLAQSNGGLLLIPLAERLTPATAAILGATLDTGHVVCERQGIAERTPARFGVIAFDESVETDEGIPVAVADRCAFVVGLREVGYRDIVDGDLGAPSADAIAAARRRLPRVVIDPAIVEALCGAALSLGVLSLRSSQAALRVARASAALAGRNAVAAEDAALAAQLVLAGRATRAPEPDHPDPDDPPPPPPDHENTPDADDSETKDEPAGELNELVLAAAQASLPPGLLARLLSGDTKSRRAPQAGRAGAIRSSHQRGRPVGARRGQPQSGVRLNVIETLRCAAPWQGIRRREAAANPSRPTPAVQVRRDDFRIVRLKERSETTTIFLVDASGSAALNRLAEAKGAVELLLADCYVRRDQVALIAFRGRGADVLLPPSRSLVRAKRCLTGLPGGGGTPLATGLDAATALAEGIRRKGGTPVVVALTDGQANISRDGQGGREQAGLDATSAARRFRAERVASLLVDISPRARSTARHLATEMGATYLSLPYADAATLSDAVRANLASTRDPN